MARTKNIAEVVRKQIADDPSLAKDIEQYAFDAEVATMVYEARRAAGLTQKQLADLAHTQQSVIARLEDWDYSGHSLSMLNRIADAVGKRLHVEFRDRFTDFKAFSSESSSSGGIEWGEILTWSPTIRTIGAEEDIYGQVA
jgi:ribosome-binding protein aMBF1 (putative translation factor)